MKIIVWDKSLQIAGYIMTYKSLIWADRYVTNGDCEIYLPATAQNVNLLRLGYYLSIDESETACVIRKIEIATDIENGDYLTVTGIDVRCLCEQRILWGIYNNSGKVERFLRDLVSEAMITALARKMLRGNTQDLLIGLEDLKDYNDESECQVSYRNLADYIRSECTRLGWGWRMSFDKTGKKFNFGVYAGVDKSTYIRFSSARKNLVNSEYKDDKINFKNVALIAGQGEGMSRKKMSAGYFVGIERYEQFVDAREIANTMQWSELKAMFPMQAQGGVGKIVQSSGNYYYLLSQYTFTIPEGELQVWIRDAYENDVTFVYEDGVLYATITDAWMATLPSSSPEPEDECELDDTLIYILLASKGMNALAESSEIISFNGEIVPDVMYRYGEDYSIGDIVTVENGYGISEQVRITEAIKVWDETGYKLNLKYENI